MITAILPLNIQETWRGSQLWSIITCRRLVWLKPSARSWRTCCPTVTSSPGPMPASSGSWRKPWWTSASAALACPTRRWRRYAGVLKTKWWCEQWHCLHLSHIQLWFIRKIQKSNLHFQISLISPDLENEAIDQDDTDCKLTRILRYRCTIDIFVLLNSNLYCES